jgi:hypothetical protein
MIGDGLCLVGGRRLRALHLVDVVRPITFAALPGTEVAGRRRLRLAAGRLAGPDLSWRSARCCDSPIIAEDLCDHLTSCLRTSLARMKARICVFGDPRPILAAQLFCQLRSVHGTHDNDMTEVEGTAPAKERHFCCRYSRQATTLPGT